MRLFRLIHILRTHWFYLATGFLLCGVPGWADQQSSSSPTTQEETLELSLEDILNIEITSVSKKTQSLSEAPAAIFVITNDDLRRSGVNEYSRRPAYGAGS